MDRCVLYLSWHPRRPQDTSGTNYTPAGPGAEEYEVPPTHHHTPPRAGLTPRHTSGSAPPPPPRPLLARNRPSQECGANEYSASRPAAAASPTNPGWLRAPLAS